MANDRSLRKTSYTEIEKETGMTIHHIKSLSASAALGHRVLIYRPVNPQTAGKMIDQGSKGKMMATKGKSANLSFVAGDIPFDPLLSKLGDDLRAGIGKRSNVEEKISKLTHSNKSVIEESENNINKIINDSLKTEGDKLTDLSEAVFHDKVLKMVEYDGQEYELKYLKQRDSDTELYLSDDGSPIFAIEIESVLHSVRLDEDGNVVKSEEVLSYDQNLYEVKSVEIMAYCNFEMQDGKVTKTKSSPITADYDELSSAAIETFSLEQKRLDRKGLSADLVFNINSKILEELGIVFNKNIGDDASEAEDKGTDYKVPIIIKRLGEEESTNALDILEEKFEISVNGEIQTNTDFDEEVFKKLCLADRMQRDADMARIHTLANDQFNPLMGAATEHQASIKIGERYDTDGATNHAAEVSNKNPEDLKEDKYPIFYPDNDGKMQVSILHNEQEICDFINERRNLGYPLDVNPRWFWLRDKDGNLFVPDNIEFGGTEMSWNNFAKIRKEANIESEGLEDQMSKKFEEYLYYGSCPALHYAQKGNSREESEALKEDIERKYEEFRERELKSISEKIKELGEQHQEDNLGQESAIYSFINSFISWKEQEIDSRYQQQVDNNIPDSSLVNIASSSHQSVSSFNNQGKERDV